MLEHVVVGSPRLPEAFDGLNVVAIADLHAGRRRGGRAGVLEVIRQINSVQADMIALLGDMFHHAQHAEQYLPLFAELQAPLGVWACLGNHEHAHMWFTPYFNTPTGPSSEQWRGMYAEVGVELLVNQARALERGGSRIWLLGVDDAYSGSDDLGRALEDVDDGGFRLALTHSPDLLDDPHVDQLDLLLAGHTHGGQLQMPLLWPLYLTCRKPRERAAGLVRENGTVMYVTRGAGEALPIRLGCPREITVMELRCRAADGARRQREPDV